MKLEEMKIRINALLDELVERNLTCLNDGWYFNQLSTMLVIVERQLAGNMTAGHAVKYGRVRPSSYPHAREDVLKVFPRMIRNYEGEI